MFFFAFLQIFPFCYVLMTKRTTACYLDVLNFIEDRLFKLQPTEVMTDFEPPMRKSIEIKYPDAKLRGCWYHYCAALYKKALKLGLSSLLKTSSGAKFIMKSLMNLPLLPENRILEGYQCIKKLATRKQLKRAFKQYFAYFESYWLRQVTIFSFFSN